MELEKDSKDVKKINEYGMEIGTLTTDRHQQISKWLRETHPDIRHYYDVWHFSKRYIYNFCHPLY